MTATELLMAGALDLALGDPRRLPHPVRLMGRIIARAETIIRRMVPSRRGLRTAGVALAVLLPALSYAVGWLLVNGTGTWFPAAAQWVTVWLAYTTLAARDLAAHALAVGRAFERGSLLAARRAVSHIVGRDTGRLSEPEVVRATVESIAESTADGVVAPLLYLTLGGPPLALAYKAINTLDSMIGHRDIRYRDLGWASARLDDAVNWIPARVTAGLLCVAAVTTSSMLRACRTCLRDGSKHPSPNSGWPEAAMAGALGVQLGGANFYGGRLCERPRLGDDLMALDRRHIRLALRLMAIVSLLALMAAAGLLSL